MIRKVSLCASETPRTITLHFFKNSQAVARALSLSAGSVVLLFAVLHHPSLAGGGAYAIPILFGGGGACVGMTSFGILRGNFVLESLRHAYSIVTMIVPCIAKNDRQSVFGSVHMHTTSCHSYLQVLAQLKRNRKTK
jgi:hypothetical protein